MGHTVLTVLNILNQIREAVSAAMSGWQTQGGQPLAKCIHYHAKQVTLLQCTASGGRGGVSISTTTSNITVVTFPNS
jgi:hypothetical protein